MQNNNEYEILLSYLDKKTLTPSSIKKDETLNEEECRKDEKPIDIPLFSTNDEIKKGFDVDKFENLMRARLIDDYKRQQSFDKKYISVSELFYCLRKSYYTRLKYEIDIRSQFNFAYLDLINMVGNAVHEYFQKIYNFTETEKTVISEKYNVKGRIDAINEEYLYEFKTLDEKKFKGIYIKEHYFQALIYAHILNTEYNYNIKVITLVYIFRDNLKRKPYTIDLPVDPKISEKFLDYGLVLQNSVNKREVPEPLNSSNDQCTFCSYKKYCEKDESKMRKPFIKKLDNEKPIDIDFSENKKDAR